MKLLQIIFINCFFLMVAYADTESSLKEIQAYVLKNKFPIYDFIKLGETYDSLNQKFTKKLTKECNRKISKLCLVSIKNVQTLKIVESTFTFYDDILIQASILVDGKGRNRIDVVEGILSSKPIPDYINYKTDSLDERVKFNKLKMNLCNINHENNSRLIKLFQSLEWERPYYSIFVSSTHLRNYVDNAYTKTQCQTAIGFIGIQTIFKPKLEADVLSIIME